MTGTELVPSSAQIDEPRLIVRDGAVFASSLDVADYFDKAHKNVLQSIAAVMAEQPEFGRLNFQPSSYRNSQNKEQPCFEMTRKGFSELVMSFTGPEARRFRIAYIERFEAMEAKLRSSPPVPALPDFTNPAIAARAWAEEYEGRRQAEEKVIELQPKAEFDLQQRGAP